MQSNNSETVSILSKWVNTDPMDDRGFFIEIQRQGKFLSTMRLC